MVIVRSGRLSSAERFRLKRISGRFLLPPAPRMDLLKPQPSGLHPGWVSCVFAASRRTTVPAA